MIQHCWRSHSRGLGRHAQFHTSLLLQNTHDAEKILRAWITVRRKHAMEALARLIDLGGETLKANGCIHPVAQDRFASPGIAGQIRVDRFRKKRFAEPRVFARAPESCFESLVSVPSCLPVNLALCTAAPTVVRPTFFHRLNRFLLTLLAAVNCTSGTVSGLSQSANISRKMARAGRGSTVVIFVRSRSADTVRIWSRATEAIFRWRRIV